MTLLSSDASTAGFNSIPGQGVMYSVVVRDPLRNASASYVPAHTYACSFASTLDGCHTLGELPDSKAIFALLTRVRKYTEFNYDFMNKNIYEGTILG